MNGFLQLRNFSLIIPYFENYPYGEKELFQNRIVLG
jgi:hypothetical protein